MYVLPYVCMNLGYSSTQEKEHRVLVYEGWLNCPVNYFLSTCKLNVKLLTILTRGEHVGTFAMIARSDLLQS